MANTLTSLIPTVYEALDIIARERIGFIPGVYRDVSAERAALNQTIMVPVVPATTAEADNTPAVTAPDTGDQTIGNISFTINRSKHIPVRWNGEETRGLNNAGHYQTTNRDRFVQAFRRLSNLIEADLVSEAYKNASRAYGTAGTAPFGTADDMTDFAGIWRILDDNGAPKDDLHLVLNNAAMQNVRGKQVTLFRANEAGETELLRNGMVMRVQGFNIHQSGQLTTVTKGSGASYLVNNGAGYAVGDTTIAVDTGSGTVLAGDIVTFAGDTNKYVVATALAAGSLVLAKPGLRATLADNVAMTVGNNFTPNIAFHRNALGLVTRQPAMPEGGDAASEVASITDPLTGITYELALYRQFLQNVIHVRLAWGYKAIKQEFVVNLLG